MHEGIFVQIPLSLAELESYYQGTLRDLNLIRTQMSSYASILDGRMKPSAIVSSNFNRLEAYFDSALQHLKWRVSDLVVDSSYGFNRNESVKRLLSYRYKHSGVSHPVGKSELVALSLAAVETAQLLRNIMEFTGRQRLSGLFLSHTASDKAFARRLASDLTRAGSHVWIDDAEIGIGDSLIQKISDGIMTTEFLGVLLSSRSVQSEWVQRELEIAITKEINQRNVVVLPLLLETCDVPAFLSGKKYADFRDKDRYEEELKKVRKALSR